MSTTSEPIENEWGSDDPLRAIRNVTPEQILEGVWPYLHMTPEERDRRSEVLCRIAMEQWMALSPDVRQEIERHEEWEKRHGLKIFARWAREYRERAGTTQ